MKVAIQAIDFFITWSTMLSFSIKYDHRGLVIMGGMGLASSLNSLNLKIKALIIWRYYR